MSSRRSVALHLLESARRRGISHAFGVHGANIEDIYDAASRLGMPAVVAKHEFAAGAMADGLARMTNGPALVLTTSGGGAMNVVPALAESYDSRVPVLAVIGAAPLSLTTRGAFQDMLDPPDTIDVVGLLKSVTGHVELVADASELEPALKSVFATLDRGLPAALVIPKDVQSQTIWDTGVDENHEPATHSTARSPTAITETAGRLADAVGRGERICLWIGDEASRTRAGTALRRIASRLGASVVAAPGGADALENIDGHAGITGVMGHPSANAELVAASICVSIGCRMTATDRGGFDADLADTEIIHIGINDARPQRGPSILVDSLPSALRLLDESLAALGLPQGAVPTIDIDYLDTPALPHSAFPSLRQIMNTVSPHLRSGTRVFADAGNVGAAAIHYLTPISDGRFTVALGMGGMGYAIAAGIGAAIGSADQGRVVIVAGDGAFFMHGMEFHTALEYDAPVTLVILNNDAHGMCVTREHLFFPEAASVNRFRPTDIAGGLAAMFGTRTEVRHPASLSDLDSACADLFADTGPNVIVVDCDPDEVPPFQPFLPKGP